MNALKKTILVVLFFIFFITVFVSMTCVNAVKGNIYINNPSSCYLVVYYRNYDFFWRWGMIAKLFTSESFFVVYDKSGNRLKNSAWYFWDGQYSDLISPKWMSDSYILYPTTNGWGGWNITQCSVKDNGN